MKNQVQLITYVDRLTAGGFSDLKALVDAVILQVVENGTFTAAYDAAVAQASNLGI